MKYKCCDCSKVFINTSVSFAEICFLFKLARCPGCEYLFARKLFPEFLKAEKALDNCKEAIKILKSGG